MRIFFKHGDGLASMDVENPEGNYLEWSTELQEKFENYIKPNFNENYTDVIEGAIQQEIDLHNQNIYNQLDIEYTQKISELVEKHVQKFITRKIPIPQEVLDEQQRLIDEFHSLTNKDLKK